MSEEQQVTRASAIKQELLLSYLLADTDAWSVCNAILKPEYFDIEYQPVVSFMAQYSEKYRELPNHKLVKAETGVSLPEVEPGELTKAKHGWICDETERFCRTQATINAVIEASHKIEKGELDDLVDPIKKAVTISLHRDLGLNYFEDPLGRLKRMLDNNTVPTHFKHVDQVLFGGVDVGSVTIFLAGCIDERTKIRVIRKKTINGQGALKRVNLSDEKM
jgi:hypothetical protein